jgi:MGT family glycosyltransferase
MRYLFVTWGGGGNLPPELAIAHRLVERGHEVRFLGHRSQEVAVKDAGCGFSPFERAPDSDCSRPDTSLLKDWEAGSPPKLFAHLRERLFFGPAGEFAADVLTELDRRPADAVAADWMLFGAHAAAEKSGLPSVALWHTPYSLPTLDVPPMGPGFDLAKGWPARLRHKALRAMGARLWNKGLPTLNAARAGIGLAPLNSVFEQFDRLDRVLVMTSEAFDFAAVSGARLPSNVRYVGPQVDLGPEARGPALSSDDRPLVLVSFSTTYQAQESLVPRVVAALGMLPVRALVTTGPALQLGRAVPANVEVKSWVPHADVLPRTDLVITHAGMGTVMASLAHGVPLLCLPMGRDQLDVTARVVHAGVGRRLSPKASEADIAAAIHDALGDRSLALNAGGLARRIRDEIASDRAVAEMEGLTAHGTVEEPDRPRGRVGRYATDAPRRQTSERGAIGGHGRGSNTASHAARAGLRPAG